MRVINSIFLEDNLEFIHEPLDGYATDEIVSKHIEKQKKGHFKAESFLKISKHIIIINTNFYLQKMLTDQFSVYGNYVMVSCVFKGESLLSDKPGKQLELGQVFISHFNESSEGIKMPPSRTRYVCILIDANYYLSLLKNEKWVTEDTFYNKVKSNSLLPLGEFNIPLGFYLQQISRQMIDCNWKQERQIDYLNIKLKELFLQLHYHDNSSDNLEYYKMSKNTVKKIRNAKAYLMTHYKNPPTIKELSKIILLNQAELKKGFKEIYGITIRAYIIDLRMKKASNLIKSNTVNDVAGILGYKSVPHFINTFKKYYGVTPKQLL